MSGTLKVYHKTVVERRRLYLDYSCWLEEGETLTSFQVVVAPSTASNPLRLDVSYPDALNTRLVMYVSGGVGHTTYTVAMIVTTNAGQTKRDDIGIKVLP